MAAETPRIDGLQSDDATAANGLQAPLMAVPQGARFSGTVAFAGAARIEGALEGNVWASGRLEVSTEACVRGSIEVDECEVAGSVEGDVTARQRLTLRSGARVEGRVTTAKLSVEEGAVLAGPCTIV